MSYWHKKIGGVAVRTALGKLQNLKNSSGLARDDWRSAETFYPGPSATWLYALRSITRACDGMNAALKDFGLKGVVYGESSTFHVHFGQDTADGFTLKQIRGLDLPLRVSSILN